MSEYIVRETGYPGAIKQEIVGELVRCKDCRWREQEEPGMVYCPNVMGNWVEDEWFCADAERREDEMPEHEAWRVGDRAECIMLTRGTASKEDDEIAHAEYVWRK